MYQTQQESIVATKKQLQHWFAVRGSLCAAATCGLLAPISAAAQNLNGVTFDPPDIKVVDERNVNIISGQPSFQLEVVKIGHAKPPLSFTLNFIGSTGLPEINNNLRGGLYQSKVRYTSADPQGLYYSDYDEIVVELFGHSESFRKYTGPWTNTKQTGGQLLQDANGAFIYTSSSGVRYEFDPAIKSFSRATELSGFSYIRQGIRRAIYPDGQTLNFFYFGSGGAAKLASVSRNDGYQIRLNYGSNGDLVSAIAINASIDYCDPYATTCAYTRSWPIATFVKTQTSGTSFAGTYNFTVTDMRGVQTRYTNTSTTGEARVTAVKRGSSANANTDTFAYQTLQVCTFDGTYYGCTPLRTFLVVEAYVGGSRWHYSYSQEAPQAPAYTGLHHIWISAATGPSGFTTSARYNSKTGIIYYIAASNGSLSYQSAEPNRLAAASDSSGRQFKFDYDARGNVTKKIQIHASNPAENLEYSAEYDAVCTYTSKCNKPNWVRDPNGNQTDYLYDVTHGGIVKATLPADSSGFRPETRYAYAQRYAWVKSPAGGLERASAPIWVLTRESACIEGPARADGAGCATGRELETVYEYGVETGPDNLLPRAKVVTAQGISLRTCFSYDALGNKISETTPRAGLVSCP